MTDGFTCMLNGTSRAAPAHHGKPVLSIQIPGPWPICTDYRSLRRVFEDTNHSIAASCPLPFSPLPPQRLGSLPPPPIANRQSPIANRRWVIASQPRARTGRECGERARGGGEKATIPDCFREPATLNTFMPDGGAVQSCRSPWIECASPFYCVWLPARAPYWTTGGLKPPGMADFSPIQTVRSFGGRAQPPRRPLLNKHPHTFRDRSVLFVTLVLIFPVFTIVTEH